MIQASALKSLWYAQDFTVPMTDADRHTVYTYGDIITSPGCHFQYRVIGPCCRLFDREQLPYPCCRLQWRGKEPSWRRIGRRFVLDIATRRSPTYSVEMLPQGSDRGLESPTGADPQILTLYWVKLAQPLNEWWYSDRVRHPQSLAAEPPLAPGSSRPSTVLATRSITSGGAVARITEG